MAYFLGHIPWLGVYLGRLPGVGGAISVVCSARPLSEGDDKAPYRGVFEPRPGLLLSACMSGLRLTACS